MFPLARLHGPNHFLLRLHVDYQSQSVDREVNHNWTVLSSATTTATG